MNKDNWWYMLIIVNIMETSIYSVITKEGRGSEKGNFWFRSYVQYERNHKKEGRGSENSQNMIFVIQSNFVIRNFLVTLKLFPNAKCSLSLWSKLAICHRKWFLNTNLFLIKTFLITKLIVLAFSQDLSSCFLGAK